VDIQEALEQGTVSRGRPPRVLRKKALVIDDN
jgi:hypothetical protein